MERQPLSFFLKGVAALIVLLVVTLAMEPRPEVNALRAFIVVGLVLVSAKLVLRRFNIDFPSGRRGRRP